MWYTACSLNSSQTDSNPIFISPNQAAFVRERCITDNTILMREIVHSFNSAGYGAASFKLKADINKAFDTVEWPFIRRALGALGIPKALIQLIMSYIGEGRIIVLVNDKSDVFLRPTRGLRQGCSLPLLIISMKFLTKGLNQVKDEGRLKGVQVAPAALIITHTMYIDDLVLFGAAEESEIRELLWVLEKFREESGLEVNPIKSNIWFSRICDNHCRQQILMAFQAKLAQPAEKYLGVFVTTSKRAPDPTHQYNTWTRLEGWKVSLPSHAGRETLIKATLTSMPVYYMSVSPILKKIVNEITSL
jgi:Reverse transcriptase (RNA-dependent DNA polymerase)